MALLVGLMLTVIGFILSVLAFVLWVWMLIDCLKNEPSDGNDKIIWVLVIIFLNGIGALIYYLIRRPERIKQTGQ
ncbi:PLD nuclease N-terminal domain-containing protein [uncultured Gimesia sp.]|uniref:PLD nuclease N-terminal domain-containing protein n=1 Tax=uncultured Gimesia sp. TaxID=1678688 RepID=UPI0030DDD9A5|tara:strand:+ start:2430 stop:2654 length:225 start_codon:yes stop_codon:yes gene_type:complete